MAKVNGFSCDNPKCSTFVVTEEAQLPKGWIVVLVTTVHDHSEGRFELCSAKCLRDLSVERYKAERDAAGSVNRGAAARTTEQKARAEAKRQHTMRHLTKPESDCEWCLAERRQAG